MSEPAPRDCESEAFRCMWSDLQSSINPWNISGILYERKVISKAEREEVDNKGNTRHISITKLLGHVERQIMIDKENFWMFVDVLKPEYNALATKLQKRVKKDNSPMPAPPPQVPTQSHSLTVQNPFCKTWCSRIASVRNQFCKTRCSKIACTLLIFIAIMGCAIPWHTSSQIPAPNRQLLNHWKQLHPRAIVSTRCSEAQGQKHQCSFEVYCRPFKSKLHQKKSDAEEEAAGLALEWVSKSGKTCLKEYCDQKQCKLEYETNPAPGGFQSSCAVMVRGLELGPVMGDVKKTKTDAEHSAAENALVEIQRLFCINKDQRTTPDPGTSGV